ncbi:uncharacterized protein KY384_006811 [Bacidia gigantensis]|uniref:uncharacterized protein n=1 Tax=Bacidia gigantensis TaxID=2732470 RepID=UPI001D04C04C|nr:uncharacterized protein KY384_006811 [Bacidia gigantensis]KAG8527895.1 hypothetical protein KY384_006811 [Bacidia gigantensis]
MSDPLSIAAGVVGILTTAAQISSVLIKFTKATKNAPQEAAILVQEVSDINTILATLQVFLLGDHAADRSRTSLLKVDQVVKVLSSCVLTFSELEILMDELKVENSDVLDRMRWARKEMAITKLVQRLQNHKTSLSLILTILNGQTLIEAKDSVDRLFTLIEQCYEDMSARISSLEAEQTCPHEIGSHDDSASTITITKQAPSYGGANDSNLEIAPGDFVEDLQRSWNLGHQMRSKGTPRGQWRNEKWKASDEEVAEAIQAARPKKA